MLKEDEEFYYYYYNFVMNRRTICGINKTKLKGIVCGINKTSNNQDSLWDDAAIESRHQHHNLLSS